MCANVADLRSVLESAEMGVGPDPARVRATLERMVAIAQAAPGRHRRRRNLWIAGLLLVGVSTAGLAGTETGRNFVRSIFTPVGRTYETHWEGPNGAFWMQIAPEAPNADEAKAAVDEFRQMNELTQAGGGRLVGFIEGPAHTTYRVQFTLANGRTTSVGMDITSAQQAVSVRIDEIMRLRNAGEGQIISQHEFPLGLGRFVIRFTLPDGQTVDLEAHYPPITHEALEAIFSETRELKAAQRFTIFMARSSSGDPKRRVSALLRYKLADGRTVGISEQVPRELISPDGKWVVLPETQERVEIQGR